MRILKRALLDGLVLLMLLVVYLYATFYIGGQIAKRPMRALHSSIEIGMSEAEVLEQVDLNMDIRIVESASSKIEIISEEELRLFGYWACYSDVAMDDGKVRQLGNIECSH